jgi:hypothetical protein
MGYQKFASPREEALEIAFETRKGILLGKLNASSTLRACLVIANSLGKTEAREWIESELSGYVGTLERIPLYRRVNGSKYDRLSTFLGFDEVVVRPSVHHLNAYLQQKQDYRVLLDEKTEEEAVVFTSQISSLLDAVIDRCLSFLNEVISELQYGGIVEYLMEEIRKNTDEKLAKLDVRLTDEAQSLFANLTSRNPADWNKVGHSCRKILSLIADKVFPPRDEPYTMKDNRTLKVGEPEFVNRICAFLDQTVVGNERKFLMAEIKYLESYLRQVLEYDQMGEHKPSIEKFHADMMAIHTYLISGEILKHSS